jgi:hypothetical protein
MISSTAFRMAGRRMATSASRKTFSTAAAAANTAKSDNARKALLATAGLSIAVAALQQREVCYVPVERVVKCQETIDDRQLTMFSQLLVSFR